LSLDGESEKINFEASLLATPDMFENLCKLPLPGDVFSQALHPTEPLLTVGLYNGRIQSFRLPASVSAADSSSDELADAETSILSDGKGTIAEIWGTRRHKKSCRSLAYTPDGAAMFSAGADGIVKHFSSATGRVVSKTLMPEFGGHPDTPSIVHAIDPQHLLLACDSGALHIFDVRDGLPAKPARTSFPHSDYISSIVPLPPTNPGGAASFPKQWVSTGGQTLAVTDLRSGTLVQSDDQEDDLLCATYVPGIGPKKVANKGSVAVGGSTGVLTLWDRGSWDDQQERIIVDSGRGGGESIDSVALMPDDLGYGKKAVTGLGDGRIRMVDLVTREVDATFTLRHDEIEAVLAIDFDCYNRMISAGGRVIQIWEDLTELQGGDSDSGDGEDDDEDGEDDENDSDNGGGCAIDRPKGGQKRARDDDSDSDGSDDSADERAKRTEAKDKKRKAALAAKLGPMGAHGVLKFDGLE